MLNPTILGIVELCADNGKLCATFSGLCAPFLQNARIIFIEYFAKSLEVA